MPDMSVTDETFQAARGWLKEAARLEHAGHVGDRRDVPVGEGLVEGGGILWNMPDMSVTPDRSGASVALYAILKAPRNASFMLDHPASPHESMEASVSAVEPAAPRFILARSPAMDTRYSPGAAYVCDWSAA